MAIKLKDTDYHYCEIGPQIVAALLAAPSMGRYFNENIKGAFDCRGQTIPEF